MGDPDPTIRVLSLGAGVQSTVLALMACDGSLPGLNAAIFADTGWEPPAVYEQVDRLGAEFKRAGIAFYRVTSGNLRADSLDPDHRFVSVPYFTKNVDGTNGMARRQCTSEYKMKPIKKQVRALLGYQHPTRVPKGVTTRSAGTPNTPTCTGSTATSKSTAETGAESWTANTPAATPLGPMGGSSCPATPTTSTA